MQKHKISNIFWFSLTNCLVPVSLARIDKLTVLREQSRLRSRSHSQSQLLQLLVCFSLHCCCYCCFYCTFHLPADDRLPALLTQPEFMHCCHKGKRASSTAARSFVCSVSPFACLFVCAWVYAFVCVGLC